MADSYEGLLDLIEEAKKAWRERFKAGGTDRLAVEFVLADILLGLQENIGELRAEVHSVVELLAQLVAQRAPGQVPMAIAEVVPKYPKAGEDGD